MRKFLSGLLLTLGLVVTSNAQPISDVLAAQNYGKPVFFGTAAVNSDPWIIIKYVGNASLATVEVVAAGDILLTSGGAADTTVNCGGVGGTVDVSNASCDTVGEVLAAINASSNWLAVNYASFLSDDMNFAGSGALLLMAATTGTVADGVLLYPETAVVKSHTIVLADAAARGINFYAAGGAPKYNGTLKPNPWQGFRTFLASNNGTFTFTGASAWALYQVRSNFATKTAPTEVVGTLIGAIATGATTVNKVFAAPSDTYRYFSDNDQKLMIRVTAVTTLTAVSHYALGYQYPSK